MPKNKKDSVIIIVNIAFVIFFITAGTFLYRLYSKNNFEALKNGANQVYKAKDEIKLPEKQAPVKNVPLPAFTKYKYKFTYDINITGYIKNMEISVPIPVDEKEKQFISEVKMSVPPAKIYRDGVNNIAQYDIEGLDNTNISLSFEGIANVRTYNINTAKLINKNLTPEKDLKKYLEPEPYIESDDSLIKSIANKIKGETQEEIVQNIYEYTQKNLNYKVTQGIVGAKKAIQNGYGKCSEYSAVMVALCRAKKIPARIVIGDIARKEVPQHNWVEVYYDKYGWVMYDPTVRATEVKVMDSKGRVVRTEKRYDTAIDIKYITTGRNIFNPFKMNYSTTHNRNGSVRVKETIDINKI